MRGELGPATAPPNTPTIGGGGGGVHVHTVRGQRDGGGLPLRVAGKAGVARARKQQMSLTTRRVDDRVLISVGHGCGVP